MRWLFTGILIAFSLTACGHRTALTLPKPDAKAPAASVPAGSDPR